jgi:hypothetical protein
VAVPLPAAASVVLATSVTRRAPQDVRLPCMVYAAVGALTNATAGTARQAMLETRKAPGVLNVYTYSGGVVEGSLACSGGVAVISRGYWLARQLLERLMDQCGAGARPVKLDDGVDAIDPTLPSLSSLTAGGAACTVQFYHGRLRIWMSTADAPRVRAAAARIAGCPLEVVDLRVLGNTDTAQGLAALLPGIALARELQSAPVQLIVGYDLGLHCLAPVLAEPARALRDIPVRALPVALAA